jgi:PIN domain nuclease of toxin-antitoxin system
MSSVVLDTSALLEPGSESLIDEISDSLLSTVNLAEAVSVLVRQGASKEKACEVLSLLEFQVVNFERAAAEETGALAGLTRSAGLSLGDHACLALAARENLPAVTADRAWRGVDVGVQIRFIRQFLCGLSFP